MLYLVLTDGYEEIEAITTLDILRRCGVEVTTISITGKRLIDGAHNISFMADNKFRRNELEEGQGIILPGGMPGATNLLSSEALKRLLVHLNGSNRLIAAICAAPMVLGRLGLLQGRRATCYPGFEQDLRGAQVTGNMVEEDANIITGRGPAAAVEFAFTIAARFVSPAIIERVKHDMLIK